MLNHSDLINVLQVVNGIMVPTFTEMFKLLAVALVDWEDHRVQVS